MKVFWLSLFYALSSIVIHPTSFNSLAFSFRTLQAAETSTVNPSASAVETPARGAAEDAQKEAQQDESELATKSDLNLVEVDLGPAAKQQRDQFLKTLKTEVEAHLPRDELDKLRRNAMRLGSYRSDWSKDAQDLVTANAPFAELVLYQFVLMRNPRLNVRIRETLQSFSSLRYPRAVLAFLGYFMMSRNEIDTSMDLLEKAVKQDPTLAPEALALVRGPLSDIVTLQTRLKFAEGLCRRSLWPADAGESAQQWQAEAKTFWEKILASELAACLRS